MHFWRDWEFPPGKAGFLSIPANTKYRPELDGLRAIAVTSVILFHAGFGLFRGGYVGVDVFFVISGFLITNILAHELSQGGFSIVGFYERRARRILPALFVVLPFTAIAAYFILIPSDFRFFGRSLFALAVFASNLRFSRSLDYFGRDVEAQPLLHTWSLSVEEQFYIFYPILIWVSWKVAPNRILAITLTALTASLAWASLTAWLAPGSGFYLLQTRAWELLIGAAASHLVARRAPLSGSLHFGEVFSGLGVAMILASVLIYEPTTPTPGFSTLLPTMGAFLVITYCTPETFAGKLLSFRPLTFVGHISYSAYLWHLPLFVLTKENSFGAIGDSMRWLLVAATFSFGYVSWRFIEQPFRDRTIIGARLIFTLGIVGLAAFALLGFQVANQEAMPGNNKQIALHNGSTSHEDFFDHIRNHYSRCASSEVIAHSETFQGFTRCAQSVADSPLDFAIVGDSHAEQLFPGLSQALHGYNVGYFTRGSTAFQSNKAFTDVFSFLRSERSIKGIVYVMYWQKRTQLFAGNSTFEQELSETLKALTAQGVQIYLLGEQPSFPFDVYRCEFNSGVPPRSICVMPEPAIADGQDDMLRRVASQLPNVTYVPVMQLFCQNQICSMLKDDTLLYRDHHHLNLDGSKYVATYLARVMTSTR